MNQITKWKLKNKKSCVKINGLKTIYVKGQQLYFDGFDALSFDTQPSSNIKSTLEYIIDDNNLIDDLLENEKEHQFSVKTIKDNKYFSISKLRKGEQKPINNKPGWAHNPLINNKKELNILQKCLLKHYFNIDIGTKPLTNIPIQIISYIRSIEKLFVLYISEIINSLNNQYYNLTNNDSTNKNHSDLYGKTDFGYTNHYQNNDKQKDECIAFVKKHLYLYKNIVSNVSIKKNNESKEQVRKLLQILSFIRNNHVLGLFYHQNSCNCNARKIQNNANNFLKRAINNFTNEYNNSELYQYPKIFLQKILNINNFNDLFYKFNFNNVIKNFGISIKKIREYIIDDNDKKEYIENKTIRYVNKCYDFIIWIYFYTHKKETNNFLNEIRTCNTNEKINQIYEEKISLEIKKSSLLVFDKLKKHFNNKKNEDFKNEYKKDKFAKSNYKNLDDNNPPDFAGFIYVMCCFLDEKEINEFTNFLIKYFSSIRSLLIVHENNFKNDENFDNFYQNYPTFKIENIENLICYLHRIQSICKLNKKIFNNKKNDNSKTNITWLELNNFCHKLFNNTNQNKINQNTLNSIESQHYLNIANDRKFIYVIKHTNLSNSQYLLNNYSLIKCIVSYQISENQKNNFFNLMKNKSTENYLIDTICKLKDVNFINEQINKSEANKNEIRYAMQIYLSALYLFTKSLKRINSLYAIAWISYEQDWYLFNKYFKRKTNVPDEHKKYKRDDYTFDISQAILFNDNNSNNFYKQNKKSYMFRKNFQALKKTYDDYLLTISKDKKINITKIRPFIKQFRNAVMHFDVLNKWSNLSILTNHQIYKNENANCFYFDIYQYLHQASFVKNINEIIKKNDEANLLKKEDIELLGKDFYAFSLKGYKNDKSQDIYDKNMNKISQYSKRFLKLINLPFAYCIARYKSLTNKQIFNKLQKFGMDNTKINQ